MKNRRKKSDASFSVRHFAVCIRTAKEATRRLAVLLGTGWGVAIEAFAEQGRQAHGKGSGFAVRGGSLADGKVVVSAVRAGGETHGNAGVCAMQQSGRRTAMQDGTAASDGARQRNPARQR